MIDTTRKIFVNFGSFKVEIRRMFRDIDAKRTAVRKLLALT
jgi:hypothetical protein